jgi:cellobiose phosphorylase
MQCGYFDDANREYVITDPKTPVKWINYIGTLGFGGYVDQTGGALICKGDPALNRITKYITQMPASDFKGETLYLRIQNEDTYQVFSPFFVPGLKPLEYYTCRVGLGYSQIVSRVNGIETDVTIFVPAGAECEVRLYHIKNTSSSVVELDCIPVVEYTHFDALKQLTNADWVPQTMQSKAFYEGDGRVILGQYAFMKRETAINYFTANLAVESFETDRRQFLGQNEYGTWANPLSLHNDYLPCTEATRGDNIGALLISMGKLQPGESRSFVTLLGQQADIGKIREEISLYGNAASAVEALSTLKTFWSGYLSKMQIVTPDPALNSMLNVHNPRQCYITKNWSRYLSYYQLGYGSRGIGFRDSSQDVLGVLTSIPDEGKTLMRQLLSVQKRNGSAMHQFNPLNMVASEGDAVEREDRPHYYCDDHLWIVMAVCEYLKETMDLDFLAEQIPYYEKDKAEKPLEFGSVFDHLVRAVEFTAADRGKHGLPLLGFADWNDTINLATGAESVLAACLYGKAVLDLIALVEYLVQNGKELPGANGKTSGLPVGELLEALKNNYAEMKASVNQQAWDGEWYISYFDADGSPMGSHLNEAGQIYTYTQAWAVISGFAEGEKAVKALGSVYQKLNTACGIKLSTPGFNGFDPRKGGITTYPPGAKENGGIFLHVNPWVIIAETLSGDGERAYAYYSQINPAGRNDQIERYECEPYVYPQNVLGDEHPLFGLARNSWLSGTASWMYQAGTKYLIGLRPEYGGLRIQPVIPAAWESFQIRRYFQGAWYKIDVQNPKHVSIGITKVTVDGVELAGNLVPVFNDQKEHMVCVVMG